MFKKCILILAVSCMMYSCATKTESNPFFTEFQTEYGVPSFDKIKLEHYEPAFLKGIEEQNQNIEAIIESPEIPTFENTIVALDNSADVLWVLLCIANQTGVDITDAFRKSMEKKTKRDNKRHINNPKLKDHGRE